MPPGRRLRHRARVFAGFETAEKVAVDAGHLGCCLSASCCGVDGENVTAGSRTANDVRGEVVFLVVQQSVSIEAGHTPVRRTPPAEQETVDLG